MTHSTEWEAVRQSGEGHVDAAVERLAELDELPTAEHVDVFEELHGRLRQVLDGLDGS